ncbi:MAG: ABC transporter ATP-binding protein [Lachnospiraceae bacterium]|nr:ABC transporter ATP-binding protein [Lachnospiraceae bacterium]
MDVSNNIEKNDDNIVIRVNNVKKFFKVYPDKGKTLKDKILFHKRNRYELREVLKGISFDVKRGEAIGLIGKNGCGKSTTLKMLTKILRPNEGTIEMKGRVSSLIELGAGFHPDLTGRENIYINASIFGIKAKEVDERLDDIIRFSELEEYIDNPVRTYSSGMYMRLAFAVAINVDADILLIDEILAVGDINFQEKCFAKLKEIKRNGTTIVIVSHAQGQIEKICDRVIWIDEGKIKDQGAPKLICKEYNLVMEGKRVERARIEAAEELEKLRKQVELQIATEIEEKKRIKKEEEERLQKEKEEKRLARERKMRDLTCREVCSQCATNAHRDGSGEVEFSKVVVNDGITPLIIKKGDKVNIKLELKKNKPVDGVSISIGITRSDFTYCFGVSSKVTLGTYFDFDDKMELEFSFINKLLNGDYFLDFLVEDEKGGRYDGLYELIGFKVDDPSIKEVGIFGMDYEWVTD